MDPLWSLMEPLWSPYGALMDPLWSSSGPYKALEGLMLESVRNAPANWLKLARSLLMLIGDVSCSMFPLKGLRKDIGPWLGNSYCTQGGGGPIWVQ